jgi:RHS repeat-associated protein
MPAVTISYAYDAAGNRTELKDSVNSASHTWFGYEFDQAGRMTGIRERTSSTDALLVGLGHAEDDQLAAIRRFDVGGAPQPASSYRYEPATGRLAAITHTIDAATSASAPQWTKALDEFFYTFDRDDRIVEWRSFLDGTATYSYDAIDQLATADRAATSQDEEYDHDEAGNRVSSTVFGTGATYVYGDQYQQNRLADDGTYTYLYHDEGTLQKRTLKSDTSKSTEYAWDHRNRLTQVVEKNGATIVKQTDLVYDALNRRIKKVHDPDGAASGQAVVSEKYVHDGDDLYLQFDSADALAHRYVHGAAVDQVLADERFTGGGSQWRWPLRDHEQSVRDLVDDAGTVLNHKMYDSFGRLASETSAAAADDIIFGWTGREFDSETGLQYNRARYYDPATGRFVSTDPSGIELSGDYNLYRYAANNPLNATDPTGLASRVLGQAASAVGAGVGSALGMYSSLTASAANSAATGIASGLAALSRPSAPVVQQVYSYNAGRYLYHDITNEQVFNHDPGYGLRTRVNSPASAPQGQSQYASWVSFAAQGLGTGLKAVVNEGVKTIASTATLGFYEAGNVWEVNRWDQSVANYSQAAFAARIGTEALQTAATGGLSQSTKFGRVGAAVNAFDTAGNVATVGRGAADVYNQGGLTWQNSAQIIGGSVGVVGNVPGLRQAASDYPRLNPLNYSATVDRSTLSMSGLGGFGLNYDPPHSISRLPILDSAFVPDGARVLQNLTNQVNRNLASNLPTGTTVLSRAELDAAAAYGGVARMQYGNAVERLVAQNIGRDSLLRSIFEHNRGPGPDFYGRGHLQGQIFDITTPAQVQAHLARPYGKNLQTITYQRPVGFP